jgi:hypothetical protein
LAQLKSIGISFVSILSSIEMSAEESVQNRFILASLNKSNVNKRCRETFSESSLHGQQKSQLATKVLRNIMPIS